MHRCKLKNLNALQKIIVIAGNDTITSEDSEVAERLNNFFIEAVESLEIEYFAHDLDNSIHTTYIDAIINKYARRPSIYTTYIDDDINKYARHPSIYTTYIDDDINKYARHPSILKIKENV